MIILQYDNSIIIGDVWSFTPNVGQKIIIPSIDVNNEGNIADNNNLGSVNYDFYISKSEVTNSEYAAFLTSVEGRNSTWVKEMAISKNGKTYTAEEGKENDAVRYISFWDAARFANWLTTGDTEQGVYNLDEEISFKDLSNFRSSG